jgi:hypothetical protein
VQRTEFSAVEFLKPSYDRLTEVIVVIFHGNNADICKVIILWNVNLTWDGAFIFRINEKMGVSHFCKGENSGFGININSMSISYPAQAKLH